MSKKAIVIDIVIIVLLSGLISFLILRKDKVKVSFSIYSINQNKVVMNLYLSGEDIAGIQGNLIYDNKSLELISIKGENSFIASVNDKKDRIMIDNTKGVTNKTLIAKLVFTRKNNQESKVTLTKIKGANSLGKVYEGSKTTIKIN